MARKSVPAGSDPFVKDNEFRELAEELEMIKNLWGGTKSMREAGRKYLPPYEAEDPRNFEKRLSRATILGVFKETVEFLSGRVFQKPLVLNDAHDDVYKFLESVDREGNDWNVFLYEIFKSGLRDSSVSVFADYPAKGDGATSLEDVKKLGLRPYWVKWEQDQVLGCRVEGIGATEHYKQIRFLEYIREDVGDFGSEIKEQVRVYEPGKCDVYQMVSVGKDQYKSDLKESRILTGRDGKQLGHIPISTFYTNRKGPLYGNPPLLDLAYKNVEHYQVYSDYLNCLIITLFPILVVSGWQDQISPGPAGKKALPGSTIAVGPTTFIKLSDPQAKVSYAEHTGAALGSGVKHLSNLKEEMAMYGLRPLLPKPGNTTATGEAIDEAREISELQAVTYRFRDFVERLLLDTVMWLGLAPEAAGSVQVNEDLSVSVRDAREIDALRAAREKGDISRRTFLEELQRRGVLSDRFDIQDEEQRLADEFASSPALQDLINQFGATGEGEFVQ